MQSLRAVELSHHLFPGQEEYQLEVQNRYVEELQPEYKDKRPPGQWYIMSEVQLWSHVGTHMEAPYHYLKEGSDIAQVPLARVVGECILIDFSDKAIREPISEAELQERGADIREGDMVFVRTGLSHNYRTPHSHDRPYFSEAAIRWLVERKIACLGVDCSGIEERTQPRQPNHRMLFTHGIPLIEHLTNLDQLRSRRFFVVAAPWRVHGLEASPVSVVAFEHEEREPRSEN
jgi:arylformamidase